MLKPYEKPMHGYSSAKLELLAFKWAMCEKFRDYLIGSKFTILTDVHTSHLGASQIHWLSNLGLFNFEIKYRSGKSNQVADVLSQQPVNPNSSYESSDGAEEWETISYEMVCQILDYHLDSSKLPYTIRYEVKNNIMDVNEANSSEGLNPINVIDVQLNEVKIFNSILPSQMVEFQKKDSQLSLVYECVSNQSKPKLSEIHRMRSKPIR